MLIRFNRIFHQSEHDIPSSLSNPPHGYVSSSSSHTSRQATKFPTRTRDSVANAPHQEIPTFNSNASLVVNYLPSKFSNGVLSDSFGKRRRLPHYRNDSSLGGALIPKSDSGLDHYDVGDHALERPVARDGKASPLLQIKKAERGLRWNRFKWVLFFTNILVMTSRSYSSSRNWHTIQLTIYSLVGLLLCLMTWFNTFQRADIIRVGNRPELITSTIACILGIFTALIGWAGILLNNRSFLAVYTFLLWIVFIFILIPGYMAYKRRVFNLEGKVNEQWSQSLGAAGRLRIQNELECCGYFSPFVEATVSQTCYARSILPGCKLAYMAFERKALKRWYTSAFLLVPLHIAVMIAGLLCSNHVTYRFGKGMMPKVYRLTLTSMVIIMEGYAR